MNGQTHAPQSKRPPSDLELMLYFDGELSAARASEVRQAIERDKTLQKKLAALGLAAEVVEENAMSTAHVSLADAIMARVAAEDVRSLDPRDAAPRAEQPLVEVKPLLTKTQTPKAAASNDNARGVFSFAAFAVAAAAGLMIWGRVDTAGPRLDSMPVAMATAPAVSVEASAPTAAVPAPPAEAEAEAEVGVEVAAVDFGSRIGTIFYVPTEAATSNHTTTVVWLSDDSAGGEQ